MSDIKHTTIIFPPGLCSALNQRRRGMNLSMDDVVDLAVHAGLRKPDAVKRALTRDHIGLDLHRGVKIHLTLPMATWEAIRVYRLEQGIMSQSEALRELIRLGCGFPQPKVLAGAISTSRTPRILELAAGGLGAAEIGRQLGISRQRVSFVIEQMRSGVGAIGELAKWKAHPQAKPISEAVHQPVGDDVVAKRRPYDLRREEAYKRLDKINAVRLWEDGSSVVAIAAQAETSSTFVCEWLRTGAGA